ncbi:MAG: DUF1272 domain-containing protein [Gemmatimonadota bacterium]
MRSACERCGASLSAGGSAYICSYECMFCAACAQELRHRCSNCGGQLVRRPTRFVDDA